MFFFFLQVCSIHFETKAYSYQDDISSSSLLHTALPTLIDCLNRQKPLTSRRPPPRNRSSEPPPPKKRLRVPSPPPVFVPEGNPQEDVHQDPSVLELDCSGELKKVQEQLDLALKNLSKARSENYLLKRQVDRLKERLRNNLDTEVELRKKILALEKCSLEKAIEDRNMPPIPAALFRILVKGKKISNWSKEKEALELALSVYFRSSSAYATLRSSGFLLPHINTLRKQFSQVLSSPGLCPTLLNMVRIKSDTLDEQDRYVTLSLDGMSLKPALLYEQHSDSLVGFEDCGQYAGLSQRAADQGVLFMVRGLCRKWKQIIGYVFCYHHLTAETLHKILTHAISSLQKAGLKVKVVCMDQEATQWKWIAMQGVSVDRPFIIQEEEKTYMVADPPHLLKNTRNNLMTKNIEYSLNGSKGTAKWSHLQQLYDVDTSHELRVVPKLTDNHLNPPRGKKMKVILACQIFSNSTAAGIRFYVEKGLLPPDAKETADFIQEMNNLWDFVDSHDLSAPRGKKPVTAQFFNDDMDRFNQYYQFVSSWKFLNVKKNAIVTYMPFHKGWLLTLQSLKDLSHEMIVEKKIKYLALRKVNQDHVENMHAQIRGYNGYNYHPMAPAYLNAIRCLSSSLLTGELLEANVSKGRNCQADGEHSPLVPHPSLPPQPATIPSESLPPVEENENFDDFEGEMMESENLVDNVEGNIVNYICGFIIRKFRKTKSNCEDCLSVLTSQCFPCSESEQTMILVKEFKEGALVRPNVPMTKLCLEFERHFLYHSIPCKTPRGFLIQSFLNKCSCNAFTSQLNCKKTHLNELMRQILDLYARIRIFHWVKLENARLKKGKKGNELRKAETLNM